MSASKNTTWHTFGVVVIAIADFLCRSFRFALADKTTERTRGILLAVAMKVISNGRLGLFRPHDFYRQTSADLRPPRQPTFCNPKDWWIWFAPKWAKESIWFYYFIIVRVCTLDFWYDFLNKKYSFCCTCFELIKYIFFIFIFFRLDQRKSC